MNDAQITSTGVSKADFFILSKPNPSVVISRSKESKGKETQTQTIQLSSPNHPLYDHGHCFPHIGANTRLFDAADTMATKVNILEYRRTGEDILACS